MLRNGASARDIGGAFGVNRNVIIGRVHRNKVLNEIGFRNEPRGAWSAKQSRAAPKQKPVHRTAHNPLPKKEKAPVIIITPPREPRAIPLMELQRGDCRWVCNEAEPGELHLFCANPADPDRPYCHGHWLRSIGQGTTDERRATRELERAAA